MNRLVSLLVLTLALGCTARPPDPEPEDTAASFRGGRLSFAVVENDLRRQGQQRQIEGLEGQLAAYRRSAEALALRQILLAGAESEDAAEAEADGDEAEEAEAVDRLRRQATLDHYFRFVLDIAPVEESDVETFYREHQELLRQPAQRFVWHLFRRHVDPAKPAATVELLRGLRGRVLAGETFMSLAREYSESETRLFDGRLGRIGRGRLPGPIEDVVFALGEGEVSEPVAVPGGAALFYVSEAIEEKQFSLGDLRGQLARHLREQRIAEHLAGAAADVAPPADSLILDDRALLVASADPNPEAEILRLDPFRLSGGQLRQLVDQAKEGTSWWLARDRLWVEIYRRQVHQQLLYLHLTRSDEWSDAERQAIDERVERGLRGRRVRRLLEERMRRLVAANPEVLRTFYNDNAHGFQSPPSLRLQTLSLPVDADAAETIKEMDLARDALVAGQISFDDAAQGLGATLVDQGWVDFETLSTWDPKLRTYLLTLGRREGFTIPFQLNARLNLIWVQDWRNPEVLPFEEVEDDVREQYYQRNQQPLYQQVVDQVLADHDFRFLQENVTRLLSPASGSEG